MRLQRAGTGIQSRADMNSARPVSLVRQQLSRTHMSSMPAAGFPPGAGEDLHAVQSGDAAVMQMSQSAAQARYMMAVRLWSPTKRAG